MIYSRTLVIYFFNQIIAAYCGKVVINVKKHIEAKTN